MAHKFIIDGANLNYFLMAVGVAYVVVLAICMCLMASVSDLAKINRVSRKATGFYKAYGVLDLSNKYVYAHKVVRKLPGKPRKEWCEGATIFNNFCSTGFVGKLREALRKGGTISFVVYLASYIIGMLVLLVALVLVGEERMDSSAYVGGTLIVGGVGLIIISAQLYFMDKKAEKSFGNFVTELSSHILKKPNENPQINNQSQSVHMFGTETKIPKCEVKDSLLKQAYLSLNDRISSLENRLLNVRKEESSIEENSANKLVYCMANNRSNNFDDLEGLLDYESQLAKGYSSIGACMTVCNAGVDSKNIDGNEALGKSYDIDGNKLDKLAEIEHLISQLVSEGASDNLLQLVHGALVAVGNTNFGAPIDEVRLKCLIKKLEYAI